MSGEVHRRPVISPPKTRELWLGQKVCAGNPSRAQTLPTLWGLVCVICRFWISELSKWTNDRFKKCLLLVWNPILLVNCWNEACLCHRGSVSHIITLWQQLEMPGLVRLLIPKDTESIHRRWLALGRDFELHVRAHLKSHLKRFITRTNQTGDKKNGKIGSLCRKKLREEVSSVFLKKSLIFPFWNDLKKFGH